MPGTSPTLQSVAAATGVSRTTVSNAYNRPDQLTAELRERILAVADEIGYAGPHPLARSLRTGTTGAIGVLLTGSLADAFSDPTAVAFLRGMAAAGEDADIGLLLVPAPSDGGSDADAIRSASVDGFVVYSVIESHPAVQQVLERRLPIVIVDEPDRGAATAYVGIDDLAGARLAAEHLLAHGHIRLAIIVGHSSGSPTEGIFTGTQPHSAVTAARLAGYRQAIDSAGLRWDDVVLCAARQNTPGAARAAAAELLGGADRPTGILATSDQLALGVLLEASARGIVVPDDLSVVGFDDIPRAAVANPALTTVRQPLFEKGKVALRLLHNAAGHLRVELPIEFINRSSTGPAARGYTQTRKHGGLK